MGWLWTNSSEASAKNGNENSTTSKIALTDEQRLRMFGPQSVKPAAGTSDERSRDQQADAELESFLKSFSTGEPTPATSSAATQPAKPVLELAPSRILPDGSLDISPEALLPRTMSCRQAFDQAFYCQSLGGKFNDIYRYGHLRSCSENWGAFWFCMRTRTLPDVDRQRAIAEYYRERDEKRKAEHGSSEDVWQIRTTAVERAFWKDPDADEG